MTAAQNLLTVNECSKSIPYPPASNADSQNFGFRVLKGKPDKAEKVKEAADLPAFVTILKSINRSSSPFFSVGCEKEFNTSADGFWIKGYIEFAFNHDQLVRDARQYFPLFFHFNKHAAEFLARNEVQFHWDLQPAQFEAIQSAGFSCCVWLTTGHCSTMEVAKDMFSRSWNLLEEFLSQYRAPENMQAIYASKT